MEPCANNVHASNAQVEPAKYRLSHGGICSTQMVSHDICGGLEPRETKNLVLAPTMFGEWGKVPREVVGSAVLTLRLTAFEDATGKRIGDMKALEEVRRKDSERVKLLETEAADLEKKVDALESQLAATPQ